MRRRRRGLGETETRRPRGAAARTARHGAALVLALALGAAGCGPVGDSGAQAGASGAPPAGNAPAPTAASAALARPDDPMAEIWWAFMPDRPYLAFQVSLLPSDGESIEGSWKSFDWVATKSSDDLRHRSKAVEVTGTRSGDTLQIVAPAPMLDANGRPNGQRGSWRLDLKESNLPGEARRYAGQAVSTEMEKDTSLPVSLERDFRRWKP
jgi:hypothetical protein